MIPAFCGKNALDQLRIYCYALGFPKKSEWPEAYEKADVLGFEIPQLPKRSISFKVDNASPEAIDLMDMMLSLNPSDRPDIKTILEHPYFSDFEDSTNPFISPVRTPDKGDAFSSHQIFTEPSFGGESMPSFGSTFKDESQNRGMVYSPVDKNDIFASGCHNSHKKAKSELNDGDGLPPQRKFSHSYEKAGFAKKAKSQHELDNQEAGFGGFNVSEFEEFKVQQNSKSQSPMDDEITNTDTAIDNFADKSKIQNEK